ncbi:MAG: amidohydrolase family protein, partial [Candidatus Rokubacteria bacterium]|nr:amidohydrolase family protein [Candidatus Rokubacteria bacterium]
LGLCELTRSGTTAFMDMGTIQGTEVIAVEIAASGLRAVFGKALMDVNLMFPPLAEPTRDALEEAFALATRFHGTAGGRLRYAFTPRFVLSCTDELLRASFAMTRDFEHSRWHTHASENHGELDAVRARCGCGNVEHLDRLGTLSPVSCLAHCIHLEPAEVDALARTGAHVLHCPGSNLKLASGVADVPGLRARGIPVSLGCDGAACNNTLDMFSEMRLAALIQKPKHGPTAMPALEVLEMATLGGARALGWDSDIGSLRAGKSADAVFLDLGRGWNPLEAATAEAWAGAVVYSARPENVRAVLAGGEWLVRDGRPVRFDEAAEAAAARNQLRKVRARAGV